MDDYVNIPENFEKSKELKTLMIDIVNVITIDRAFLSSLQEEGGTKYHIITLFVDANSEPIPNETVSFVTRTGKRHPDFRIRVYTENQFEIGAEVGSLYFIRHCRCGTVIYTRSDNKNQFDYSDRTMDTLIKRSKRYFDKEMRKVDAFARSAEGLLNEGDYAIATFSMHQAYELSFRCIEQMCIGKSRITHSIISHINYCKPFFPTLRPFFEASDMKENELLLLLEHAYSVARYGNEFEIAKEQVLRILGELKDFINKIQAIFQRHLTSCIEGIERLGAMDDIEPRSNSTIERREKEEYILDSTKEVKEEMANEEKKEHKTTLLKIQRALSNRDGLLKSAGYSCNRKPVMKTEFPICNNDELMFNLSCLLKTCVLALEGEAGFSHSALSNADPKSNVTTALEFIISLLPREQMMALDEITEVLIGLDLTK
ncbi:HEPN domain-containing protein [Zobellia uliginosa]|uniref:HEPN domain-containing protein n=1 Tax=Zobellia uliginosa TaxID=143224 RepID=UPI0026E47495|nr:HEPN domain-containing protein [Zobellia uliginosa]MDO6517785.1 HEPN domain-containing protein [Zobellia uliginosa]